MEGRKSYFGARKGKIWEGEEKVGGGEEKVGEGEGGYVPGSTKIKKRKGDIRLGNGSEVGGIQI